ncbi:MAG: M48 family metalloprotease [Desulfuromonadaceae bacterium]|nr:M48 family metalloprotease [Desulfuromonadaceae bacterium]MDD2849133.1 M48 family metalloprotease [Desulfuromonadaceae bacterium]MDD4129501.1 M48 family metalloprotease [Desulfuromonadaceae bacterium]
MRHLLLFVLLALAVSASSASAGFFDKLQKLADPESKERKIFSGATQVLSSSQEIDYPTERVIGESLALEGLQRFGNPVKNESLQKYVNLVGNAVAVNSKRATIPYQFAVLDSPVQNAFAVPGGVIFVSRALVSILDDEAELAAVLAHEVGHVSAKHALKSTQRAQFFEGVGTITAASVRGDKGKKFASAIGDMQAVLFDKGLDKEMEFEADAAAMETSYRTGYDPAGMIRVLEKLQKVEATSKDKKGSWFSTHPPLNERIARLQAQLQKYPGYSSLVSVRDRFAKYAKLK